MTVQDRQLLNGTVTTESAVVARADLSNFDPARGRITLNLTANGTVVAQRTVTVGIDSRRTVYLRTTLDLPGRYEMRLNGTPVGTVTVIEPTETPTDTDTSTGTVDRPTESQSPTVAPTPEGTSTERETSTDRETDTGTPARSGTGTARPPVGPDDPTGTDAVLAAGMSLMLLYGVGVAVYVLREHPPGGLD